MSITPASSASRGEVTLQPSYFTSCLFVHPLRDDIQNLIHIFTEQYVQSQTSQPFLHFKKLWSMQGWTWMHFKVFDVRARDSFLKVTARLFIERLDQKEGSFTRVVALFGLYTFFMTQPSFSAPHLHSIEHIPIPIDQYISLIDLPNTLTTTHLLPLQPHTAYILSILLTSKIFHIVPESSFHSLNPRELPREIFVQDGYDSSAPNYEHFATTKGKDRHKSFGIQRKKGRPTKRERAKKAKDALGLLEKWLDKDACTLLSTMPPRHRGSTSESNAPPPATVTTHILLSNPPTTSRTNYQNQKSNLFESFEPSSQSLQRANQAILTRMRKIDEMAAEKGLEVGGEGGERTGLARVEKAVKGLDRGGKGILELLEGAGLDGEVGHMESASVRIPGSSANVAASDGN